MKTKLVTATVISIILLSYQTGLGVVYAAPTPPPAPTAPPAPSSPPEPTAPPAPTTPPAPGEATPTPTPPAPSSPPEPTAQPTNSPSPEATPTPSPTSSPDTQDQSSPTPSPETSPSPSSSADPDTSNDSDTDGQAGDSEVSTGDATNSATIQTDANTNLSTADTSEPGGITVINDENGADSDNSASATIVDDDTTIQNNTAKVINNLDQETTTGDNSASKNVGDSTITTGDANTTGTIINSVNTNVDGIVTAEFNVADDHIGDIILDFGSNCLSGCGNIGDITAQNTQNGADSDNNTTVNDLSNDYTFQNNDASIQNNMTLESNSGDNKASKNTAGDSTITTGDANVAANVLNLANNNLAGNILYSVVNIFGDLVGDIILSEEEVNKILATNTSNGSGSTNSTDINSQVNDATYQFNNANINNNLILDAETGDNKTIENTNGDSYIQTGDTTIDAQIINIANSNISDGTWWLVIVNEAGNWIGKIMGAPEGALFAGSQGTDFQVNENGEITAMNSGNGADSTNNANANTQSDSTLVQNNTANIQNNIKLSANTGGNKASQNTGGNSSITTGDAQIIANIVNFVNNNVSGSGQLVVSVVNVFGSWIGDFITPGNSQDESQLADAAANESDNTNSNTSHAIGGTPDQQNDSAAQQSNSESSEGEGDLVSTGTVAGSTLSVTTTVSSYQSSKAAGTTNIKVASASDSTDAVLGTTTAGSKAFKINLAWFLAIFPIALLAIGFKKRNAIISLIPKRA